MFCVHPFINTPEDSAVVWRYMSIDNFLFLVTNSKLYFCRPDKFKDPWEGVWPKPIIDGVRSQEFGEKYPGFKGDAIIGMSETFKRGIYLNCWYCRSHESAAMWDLYGKSGASIAIKSTIGKLKKGIIYKNNFFIGKVDYIDYEKDTVDELNFLLPYFIKRKSFEHEQEVRLLIIYIPEKDLKDVKNSQDEILATIDFKTLIDNVYVSPSAPSWMKEVMQNILDKFGYGEIVVKQSNLYEPHVY
ncbi:MAG: DUF2971 domain-containing protein [Phycisphaerae bacterium]|nr:DUF2971 domain-containing protein [Phycisphaerae bacterium]